MGVFSVSLLPGAGAESQAVNGEPYSRARVSHLSTGPSDLCKAIAVSEAILVSGIGDVVVSALLKVNSAAPWHEFRIMEYDAVGSLIQPGNPTVSPRARVAKVTNGYQLVFFRKVLESNARSIRIRFGIGKSSDTSLLVDDVRISVLQ